MPMLRDITWLLLAAASTQLLACADGGGASCVNGRQDPTEDGVDCGGVCGLCPGASCTVSSDCASLHCAEGGCALSTCTDGIQNGYELGVDCGGPCRVCATVADATCSDGAQNGDETGVDCGGSCPICAPAHCGDDQLSGDESDTDCGGSCAPCSLDESCRGADDCASGVCDEGVCVASRTCVGAYDCVAATCAESSSAVECVNSCFSRVPASEGVTAADAVACIIDTGGALDVCKARCDD